MIGLCAVISTILCATLVGYASYCYTMYDSSYGIKESEAKYAGIFAASVVMAVAAGLVAFGSAVAWLVSAVGRG